MLQVVSRLRGETVSIVGWGAGPGVRSMHPLKDAGLLDVFELDAARRELWRAFQHGELSERTFVRCSNHVDAQLGRAVVKQRMATSPPRPNGGQLE